MRIGISVSMGENKVGFEKRTLIILGTASYGKERFYRLRFKFSWIIGFFFVGLTLYFLYCSFPVKSFAEPNTQTEQEKINPNFALKVYRDLVARTGGLINSTKNLATFGKRDKRIEQEIIEKYNLTPQKLEKIIEMGKGEDFQGKTIQDEVNKIKNSNPKLNAEQIKQQAMKNLGVDEDAWKDYEELVKKQDEAEKEKLLEVGGCTGLITSSVCEFFVMTKKTIADFFIDILGYFVSLISIDEKDFYGPNYQRYHLPEDSIYKYQKMVQEFAWGLLSLFFVYQTVRILALYTVEPNGILLKNLLLKFFVTAIMIQYEPYIIAILLEMNGMITDGLVNMKNPQLAIWDFLVGIGITGAVSTGLVATSAIGIVSAMSSPIWIAIIVVLVGLIFIFLIQVSIRFVEITILAILGPIVIATNINEQYNLFPSWWRHLLSSIFTITVQFFLVLIMWAFMTNEITLHLNLIGILTKPFVCIAFLVVTINSPGFLKEWMYSSGVASGAVEVAKPFVSKGAGIAAQFSSSKLQSFVSRFSKK